MFGSRRSCLEFRCRVGVQTLVSLCERALSRLCALCRVGAWCSDPGAHVLSFGVVSGFGHSSLCVSVRSLVCVLVSCWSVVFGSRRSCLEFRCRVGVRTLVSLCERALSRLCALCRVGAWCSDPGAHVLSFGVVSGFRHSSLCVSVRSLVRVLFRVGAWCSDPGAHVLSFGFVSGFGHSSHCVSVRSRVRSTVCSSVHVCSVVLHAVCVSIGCVYSCYILCCVGRSLCIHWLSAFMLSCLV